jgi:VanW like protein
MEREQLATAHPSLSSVASFFVRSKGLQAKRAAENILSRSPRLLEGAIRDFPFVLAESVSPLHTTVDPRERPLLLGKIQNLRLASRNIHHRVLLPGETFSFWRQVGPPWRLRGFETGREVREGCVIPTSGGGVCQLSGSLLEVVLSMGFELIERHGHTALPADVSRDARRDATVFWNYVDLRFRTPFPVLFESYITEDALVIRVRGQTPRTPSSGLAIAHAQQAQLAKQSAIQSCYVCHETACIRHLGAAAKNEQSEPLKTAFLVDEYQPEFDRYVQRYKGDHDQLSLPFRSGPAGSSWSVQGFGKVRSFPVFRFRRSWTLRRTVSRGLTVAKAHFANAEALARIYEKHIAYDVEHVCVAQTLLPHLWRAGVLGGRSFDVLMYRFPSAILEQHLDNAAHLYPQSKTLIEFRAPRWFIEAEEQALHCARRIVTPHAQIATFFDNAFTLPWEEQTLIAGRDDENKQRDLILFLGPTLARKGAHAVREAVKKKGFSLLVLGSDLEQAGFWKNLPVTSTDLRNLPWNRVHTVLQPALFEHWPRQLLRAHAAGSHLVISPNCGLAEDHDAGIYHVSFGDSDALVSTMETLLTKRGTPVCAA